MMLNDRQMRQFEKASNHFTYSLVELEELGQSESGCQKFYEKAKRLKEQMFDRWMKEVKLKNKAKGEK